MHLHGSAIDIVHGNIKPENALVFKYRDVLTAEMTGFGFSCFGTDDNDIVRLPHSLPWAASRIPPKGHYASGCKENGCLLLWDALPVHFVSGRSKHSPVSYLEDLKKKGKGSLLGFARDAVSKSTLLGDM